MGTIRIEFDGSFGCRRKAFAARDHGHVDAVANAIGFLAEVGLPHANRLDRGLHEQGQAPRLGWDRPPDARSLRIVEGVLELSGSSAGDFDGTVYVREANGTLHEVMRSGRRVRVGIEEAPR